MTKINLRSFVTDNFERFLDQNNSLPLLFIKRLGKKSFMKKFNSVFIHRKKDAVIYFSERDYPFSKNKGSEIQSFSYNSVNSKHGQMDNDYRFTRFSQGESGHQNIPLDNVKSCIICMYSGEIFFCNTDGIFKDVIAKYVENIVSFEDDIKTRIMGYEKMDQNLFGEILKRRTRP
jgi:hypothetical protein